MLYVCSSLSLMLIQMQLLTKITLLIHLFLISLTIRTTCFEYADGKNAVNINDEFLEYTSGTTDLDIYYQKIGDVYGSTSGREIEPETVEDPLDIETKIDEYRIVGSRGASVGISSIRAGDGETSSSTITVTLSEELDGLDVDTPIQISGVSVNGYTGQFVVSEKNSATEIEYKASIFSYHCATICI